MWIFLQDAFISVVDKSKKPGCLCVRARCKGDLQRLFPGVPVTISPSNDYLFRADVLRSVVAKVIADRLMDIRYDNFKAGVVEEDRHSAYLQVWGAMNRLQENRARASGRVRRPAAT